jgi:UDP-N-acetyl-D-galactosamine dehydrogenase
MSSDAMRFPGLNDCNVGIVGLGYVGLPLAVEIASKYKIKGLIKKHKVIAYDIDENRLIELSKGIDITNEVPSTRLSSLDNIVYTNNIDDLANADLYIVTVPTPIDKAKQPDLSPLRSASKTVGRALSHRIALNRSSIPIVVYESTVYPGATEEICVPVLEASSGLTYNKDFFVGYSPERVSPADRNHTLTKILKLTSGSTASSADWIDSFYTSFITAGTYKASSIMIAEAAKVIENTQRDVNIALMNELAHIFNRMNLDIHEIIKAASTKWNFLPFKPGLVGGHCIGIDPYYLTHISEQHGYSPLLINASRRINEAMSSWLVNNFIFEISRRSINLPGCRVLVLGLTFKENCPDLRNTKVLDVIHSLIQYKVDLTVVDEYVPCDYTLPDTNINVLNAIPAQIKYEAILVCVAHSQFLHLTVDQWASLVSSNGFIYDIKGIVPMELAPVRI